MPVLTLLAREPVLSKKQNWRLWQSGAYGTRLRSWRSLEEWRESGFRGRVAVRALLPGGGGPCFYDLEPGNVLEIHSSLTRAGVPEDCLTVDEAAPACQTILQGEYLNDVYDYPGGARYGALHYSRAPVQMRAALAVAPEDAHGLRADLLLALAMTPTSREDWRDLLASYPGHVLEVSVYDRCVGDLPGRNALVWEVRRY